MSRPNRRAAQALACPLALLAVLAIGLAIALAWSPPAARGAELQIEAPRFTFDQAANTYTYEDGRLTLGELSLFATHMELNATSGQVLASGFVRIETPEVSGIAEAAELDANTRTGVFHQADLFVIRSRIYLRAEEVMVHPDGRLQVRSCTFTSCPPEVSGGWSVAASSMNLEPDGLGVAWNPRLSLGPVPVLWLPGIAWPTVNERRTGLLPPSIGSENSSLPRFDLGGRLLLPVFVNLGYDHDVTLTPEWIQHRGTALEAEYNYAFWPGQRGRLTLWGLRERDARTPADENDVLTPLGRALPTDPSTRTRSDWEHNQGLGAAGRLVLSWHDSSDGQVRREYDRITEFRPYRTYQASLTGQWAWADLSLTAEQNADFLDESVYARDAALSDVKLRPQLLPRLGARLGGRLFAGLPLTLELGLSATRFRAEEEVSGGVVTASPALIWPIDLGGAFELRPSVTRHLVAYSGLSQYNAGGAALALAEESFGRTEASLELRTALARIYSPAESRYEAFKHRMVPRLILTAVEDVDQPYADEVLRARVAERLVTLRLDNVLLGRPAAPDAPAPLAKSDGPRPPAPVSELLRLNLIQRYDLLLRDGAPARVGPPLSLRQESEAGEPLLPLLLELDASGAGFSTQARLNFHHQLHRTTESRLSLNGQGASGSRFGIAYASNEFSYVTPDNKVVSAADAFTVNGALAWSDAWSAGFGGRVNLSSAEPPLDRRLDRVEAYLDYHPKCYALRFSYVEQVASIFEGGALTYYVDRSFKITFDLIGLVGGPVRLAAAPRNSEPFSAAPLTAAALPIPPSVQNEASPAACRG